jgi:NAD(P)H-nitrite reductase large subunit
MPKALKTHYAIVGAGIAGVAAAEAIREIDTVGAILLINGEAVQPYCRPLIVEVLKGERSTLDIRLRSPEWFTEKNISLITGSPAVRLDAGGKRLDLKTGRTVEWRKLLVATGSRPAIPPIKGLDDVASFTLAGQDDVDNLKPRCKPGAKALLVGIGLVGLQAITALTELGVKVTAVELMPKMLPVILDAAAAAYAQKRLEQHGVEVRVGTAVGEVRRAVEGKRPYVAFTDKGTSIPFDFIIVAAGMKPDLSLLDGSGIEADRGIRVAPDLQTSVPDVYAAGDVTEYSDWIEGRPEVHANWVNAYHQGRIAGISMAGGIAEPYQPVHLNSLDVFGLPFITIGASRIDNPEGAQVYVTESPSRPAYTRFVVRDGRLIAATFIGDVDRAGVFHYLIRERIEVADIVQALFEQGLEGMEFLYKLHEKTVRGDVEWAASMGLIDFFEKDPKHTRWGGKEGAERRDAR